MAAGLNTLAKNAFKAYITPKQIFDDSKTKTYI